MSKKNETNGTRIISEESLPWIGICFSLIGIFISLVGILLTWVGLEKEQVKITLPPSPWFIISLVILTIAIIILLKKKNIQFFGDRNKAPKRFNHSNLLNNMLKRKLNLTVIGRTNITWFENIEGKKEHYKKALKKGCKIKFIIQHEFVKNINIKDDERNKKIKEERKNTIQNFKNLYEELKAVDDIRDHNFELFLTSIHVNNSMTALHKSNDFPYFSYDIGLNIDRNPFLVFLNNSIISELRDQFIAFDSEENCIDIFTYEERYNEGKTKIDALKEKYSKFSLQRDNQNKKMIYHYFDRKKCLEKDEFYPPISVQLMITNRCTTNCIMCDHHSINSENELSGNEIGNIIDYINDLGTKNIIISGGEPLFRNDCIEILEVAKKKILNVGLLTNGIKRDNRSESMVSITRDDAQRIKNTCDWVQLSVDSFDPDTYQQIRREDVNKVKESIGNLEIAGVNVEIVFTIQKLNIDEAIDIITSKRPYNNKAKIRFKFAHGPNNSNDFLLSDDEEKLKTFIRNCKANEKFNTEYIAEMFKLGYFNGDDIINGIPLFSKNKIFSNNGYTCHVLNYSCKIDAEGCVYPCCFLYDDNMGEGSKIRSKYNIGSLRAKGAIAIMPLSTGENRLKTLLSEKNSQFRNNKIPIIEDACDNCTRHFYQNDFLNELDKIVTEYKDINFIDTYTQKEPNDSKIWI
jgi:MoaA/NifB/PqqE/SkfB family radical SAM enzyme